MAGCCRAGGWALLYKAGLRRGRVAGGVGLADHGLLIAWIMRVRVFLLAIVALGRMAVAAWMAGHGVLSWRGPVMLERNPIWPLLL